jgi:hypothetical protein
MTSRRDRLGILILNPSARGQWWQRWAEGQCVSQEREERKLVGWQLYGDCDRVGIHFSSPAKHEAIAPETCCVITDLGTYFPVSVNSVLLPFLPHQSTLISI